MKSIFPQNTEEIFTYALKLKNGEDFARSNINTILINNNNRQMNHKHIIFFSYFDIKRILISENILVDGTFSFPVGFI